jgi:hypothetical protein
LPTSGKIEESGNKFDAFKDIYNYSKQTITNPPVRENKNLDTVRINIFNVILR